MDFFNKVSAKAEETFQTIKESDVTKKAINYAEIPGLSVQVGRQESIARNAYSKIGEIYYKAHKDELENTQSDSDDEYLRQMRIAAAALKKADELRNEIEERKKYDPSKDARRYSAGSTDTETDQTQDVEVIPARLTVVEDAD